MADYLVTDTELTSVANAIRTKGGTSASLSFPTDFVSAINAISGGLEYEEGTFTPTSDLTCYENPILFSDTHTEAPSLVVCGDQGGDTTITTTNAFWGVAFANVYKLIGHGFYNSAAATGNGIRGFGTWKGSTSNFTIQFSQSTGSSGWSTNNSYIENMVSSLGFYVIPRNYTSYCFKAGRTYKWIAIWT